VYPESGRLLGMLAECEQRGHTLSRLRLHLTGLCQGTPSALLWLMAIKAEATVPAGSHRVQATAQPCCVLCCCVVLDCAMLFCPVVLWCSKFALLLYTSSMGPDARSMPLHGPICTCCQCVAHGNQREAARATLIAAKHALLCCDQMCVYSAIRVMFELDCCRV